MSESKTLVPTLNGNIELAKIDLVLGAINNLQNTIISCHGVGEFHNTTFDDEDIRKLFYEINEYACQLYDKKDKIEEELGNEAE